MAIFSGSVQALHQNSVRNVIMSVGKFLPGAILVQTDWRQDRPVPRH